MSTNDSIDDRRSRFLRQLKGLLVAIPLLNACANQDNNPTFRDRAKCDELVRKKFVEIEHRFVPSPHKFVTSNLSHDGRCYGLMERNGDGTYRIMIDGVSGKDLAMISRVGTLVMTGMVDDQGKWSIREASDVEGFIDLKMKSPP